MKKTALIISVFFYISSFSQNKADTLPLKNDKNIIINCKKCSSCKTKSPLIVIDGAISSKIKLEAIDPNTIKSINVLKGEKASELFGKAGKDGVIVVNLKTKKELKKERKTLKKK